MDSGPGQWSEALRGARRSEGAGFTPAYLESPFYSVDYSSHISHATGFLAIRLAMRFYNDDVLFLFILSGIS